MTYYVTMHNSGYMGQRAYNTLAKALIKAQSWVLMGGNRSAEIDRNTRKGPMIYRYWIDKEGMQFIKY
jgi:hypothetical protein